MDTKPEVNLPRGSQNRTLLTRSITAAAFLEFHEVRTYNYIMFQILMNRTDMSVLNCFCAAVGRVLASANEPVGE